MSSRRILYSCIVAATAFFYVLYYFWIAWYLLLLVVLILPFDFIISLPGMLNRRITLSSPKILERGEDGVVVLIVHAQSKFPAGSLKLWMKCSGDDFSVWKRFTFSSEDGYRYEVQIDPSRTGVTSFEMRRLWTVSLLGLICLPHNNPARTSVLVLPPAEKPPHTVALPRGIILKPKPGGGFSEDYDLRPYRAGDPIRAVHWKVSAKYDSLIIREPLVPPAHSRLLHAAQWNTAAERDLVLSRLRWVSDYLLKWDLAYYVRLGEEGPVAEITENSQLLDYLYNVLDGSIDNLQTASAVPIRFAWVFRVDGNS